MRPELVTFDCYGTLIDWERGIGDAFLREARRDGVELRVEDAVRAYHEAEREVEAGPFRPYREVLREAASRAAAGLGWSLAPERARFLAESLPEWPPFADTNRALDRLNAAGYRLGILSNVDDNLLADTLQHFTVAFDLILTAEQLRSYKPAPAHFRRALEEVGGRTDRLVHAAQSWYHDVRPAVALGIPTVWVNRAGEPRPDAPEPAAEVSDLDGAVRWLDQRASG